MSIEGIDVYSGTGGIEWHRVASAGKRFAFIRGAYGDVADKMVVQNFAGAKAAALMCGIYHFYRAPLDVNDQIRVFCGVLDKIQLGPSDLPPVIDIEDNPAYDGPWNPANNASYLADLQRWLQILTAKVKRPPMLYLSPGFWAALGNPSGFQSYPLWIANYEVKEPKLPPGWTSYDFWQYTDVGTVDGIAGHCDLDFFNGTESDLDNLKLS